MIRIETHHLAEHPKRRVGVSCTHEAIGDVFEHAHGIADQLQLLVHLAEPHLCIQPGWIELQDLFVDRNGLQKETLLRVVLGNGFVGLDGGAAVAFAHVQIADLQQRAHVALVRFDELSVLRDRFVVLAACLVLPRGVQDLISIDAQSPC